MSAGDLQDWIANVRDPAEANAEPVKTITVGKSRAEWRIAHVPGGWTWRARGQCAGPAYEGFGTPWTSNLEPSQTAATDAAVNHLIVRFTNSQDRQCGPLIDKLRDVIAQPGLFDEATA